MPAIGEQHRASNITTNPFEETQPRLSEYTAQEIATLQSRLNKQLGPEYISARAGPAGGRLHYVAAEKCIQLANEVFGFNGWSSSIREVQVDYVEELPHSGKFNMGISVIMRVMLRDGSFHEDIGYGHIENCKSKAMAFEKTKKEATTDALKRALRNFGNVLGNCIYDKDYISKVTRMKVAPTKFAVENLHRHSDHAPIKKEVASEEEMKTSGEESHSTETHEADDEFGADFDEVDFGVTGNGHPDEVMVDAPIASAHPPRKGNSAKTVPNTALQRASSTCQIQKAPPSRGPVKAPSVGAGPTTVPAISAPTTPQQRQAPPMPAVAQRPQNPPQPPSQMNPPQESRPLPPRNPQQSRPMPQQPHASSTSQAPRPNAPPASNNAQLNTGPNPSAEPVVPANPPIGFFAARAAEAIQAAPSTLPENVTFNPHAESPSIPKTAGIDHTRSKPIQANRDAQPPIPPDPNHNPPQLPTLPSGAGSEAGVGAPAPPPPQRQNFINPHLDTARRIGMPGAHGTSPLQNRSSYKVPTLKRPAEGPPPQASAAGAGNMGPVQGQGQRQQQRPALADVTGASTNARGPAQVHGQGQGGPPEKKVRVGPGAGTDAGAAAKANGVGS